jgi:DNA polymerase/3'-5' exonuclease PolX
MNGVCPLDPAYDRSMPQLPRNSDVADALEELADVSEILGEQGFRVLAYRRAATRVRDTASSIAELALAGTAKELPGIGATIEAKVVELTESRRLDGTWGAVAEASYQYHRLDSVNLHGRLLTELATLASDSYTGSTTETQTRLTNVGTALAKACA